MEQRKKKYLNLIAGNFKSPLNKWEQEVLRILRREKRKEVK